MRSTLGLLGGVAVGALVIVACDGATDSKDSPEGTTSGRRPTPAQAAGAAGSDPDEDEVDTRGGGGGGEVTSEPDVPTPEELADEIERIAGTSFVVRAGDSSDTSDCRSFHVGEVPAFVSATLSFVKDEAGDLELIASVSKPWLRVTRSTLARRAAGWVAREPVALGGCLAHVFEEEEADTWATPDELLMTFSGADPSGQPTTVDVNAHFPATSSDHYSRDAVDLVGQGERDREAPRLVRAGDYEHIPLDGGGLSRGWFPRLREPYDAQTYRFTELLAPGWSVSLEDPTGKRWTIADSGSLTDFTAEIAVDRYFPEGSRWVLEGRDLAGNELRDTGYVVDDLALTDGEFESDTMVAIRDFSSAVGAVTLSLTEACQDDPRVCRASELPDHPGVLPIAGTTSALLDTWRVFLRISRLPDATELRLAARAVSDHLNWQTLGVRIVSLDVGAPFEQVTQTFDGWQPDASFDSDTNAEKVSELRDIVVPLPPGEGDVLVVLETQYPLWLDAVRTQ
jgi:hypothetical protein